MKFILIILIHFVAFGLFGQSADGDSLATLKTLQQAAAQPSFQQKDSLLTLALEQARTANNDALVVRALIALADLKTAQKENNKALSLLLEAEARSNSNTRVATENLLAIHRKMGDLFFQEHLYMNAVAYYRKVLENKPQELDLEERIADSFLADMQFDSAEIAYKGLIAQFKSTGNRTKLIEVYQKIANAYDKNLDDGKALLYYLRIKDLVEQGGSLRDKAVLYNNLGRRFMQTKDYVEALKYFRNTEIQCDFSNCDFLPIFFTNYGICLHNTGQTEQGIGKMLQAISILDKETESEELGTLEQLISRTYFSANDLYNALAHNKLAIDYGLRSNNRDLLISAYEHAANLHFELYEYEKAYEFYKKYLTLVEQRRNEEEKRLESMTQQQFLLERSEKEHRSLLFQQQLKELALQQATLEKEKLEAYNKNLLLEAEKKENDLALLKERERLNESELKARALEALKAKQEARLAAKNLETERKDREIQSLKLQEQEERIRQATETAKQEAELADAKLAATKAEMAAQQKLEKERNFRNLAYSIGALFLLILGLLAAGYLFSRRTNLKLNKQNRRIELQNQQIAKERERSDQLLLNILPEEIAQELKENGGAKPKLHEETTVLFTDFQSFTSLTEGMTAEELIEELNECFQAFDDICEQFGLEKIKTIGDAYMCVAGVPMPQDNHAERAVLAALAMLGFLEKRKLEKPQSKLQRMRIGLHSGPVVAGVVGKNKFAYDIWGDTVNTAARMEQHGEAGKVAISKTTADRLNGKFNLIDRGESEVSGKGYVQMYFVEKRN